MRFTLPLLLSRRTQTSGFRPGRKLIANTDFRQKIAGMKRIWFYFSSQTIHIDLEHMALANWWVEKAA